VCCARGTSLRFASLGTRVCDRSQYAVHFVFDFLILKSQDFVSISFEMFGSGGILLRLIFMYLAVKFDDESASGTAEIGNDWSKGMLATPFVARESFVAQLLPQQFLGFSHLSSERLGRFLHNSGCPYSPFSHDDHSLLHALPLSQFLLGEGAGG
jgi:hypothetical protein